MTDDEVEPAAEGIAASGDRENAERAVAVRNRSDEHRYWGPISPQGDAFVSVCNRGGINHPDAIRPM